MLDIIQISPENMIYAFDMLGVIGCAIAGSIQAYRSGLDPMGTLLIAAVTALGGGTIRDILLDRNPIFWMFDENYLYVVIIVSLFVQAFYVFFEKIDKILRITDAIGLATFTIIGVEVGLSQGASGITCLFMGVITSCFGGIVRDIICNEVPLILHKDIYILASIVGGLCFLLLHHLGFDKSLVYLVSGLLAFVIRLLAVYRQWNLPQLGQLG